MAAGTAQSRAHEKGSQWIKRVIALPGRGVIIENNELNEKIYEELQHQTDLLHCQLQLLHELNGDEIEDLLDSDRDDESDIDEDNSSEASDKEKLLQELKETVDELDNLQEAYTNLRQQYDSIKAEREKLLAENAELSKEYVSLLRANAGLHMENGKLMAQLQQRRDAKIEP